MIKNFESFEIEQGLINTGFKLLVKNNFLQIFQIFIPRFTHSLDKVTVEICQNFYYGLLKNFLSSF